MVTGVSKINIPALRHLERFSGGPGRQVAAGQSLFLGPENRLVEWTIARVIDGSSPHENPFVFWGVSGTGKSLVARCILHYWTQGNQKLPPLMTNAKDWIRHVDESGHETGRVPWLTTGEKISLFVIEDVGELTGRKTAQHELCLLLDDLSAREIAVIVTCRQVPSDVHLEPRLVSRLLGGTLVRINLPAVQTKHAFARALDLNIDVRESLARRLDAAASLSQVNAIANRLAIEDVESPELTPETIVRTCARYFGFTPAQIRGTSRRRAVIFARQITVFLLRDMLQLSFKRIGHVLGKRDHSTIMHAHKKVTSELQDNPSLYSTIDAVESAARRAHASS